MRDPERIDRILNELKITWEKFPDWRLCQLIVNLCGRDPFYLEDDKFEKMLKELNNDTSSTVS